MPSIVTRKVALEKGLPRYFSGKACKRGHVAERTTRGATCVVCNRERSQVVTAHDSLKKREANLKQRYGMSITEFADRVELQGSRCAICRNLSKSLVVDHCHAQNKVRDLLCQRCNSLLGLAEDQIEILTSAVDYIVRHS